MLRFLVSFILFISWLSLARHYYFCHIKGDCAVFVSNEDPTLATKIPYTLSLMAGDYMILEGYPEFYFDFGSHEAIFMESHLHFLEKTAAFLQQKQLIYQHIELVGRYKKSEIKSMNTSQYSDLGIARAQVVGQKLIELSNISLKKINFRSEIQAENKTWNQISVLILGLEGYSVDLNQKDTALLRQIKTSVEDITYTHKQAQFDYNSGQFSPNKSFGVYIDSLKSYFNNHPRNYLLITGHTDSKGSATYNKKLGLTRAQHVKDYMIKQGLTSEIKLKSAGASDLLVKDRFEDGTYSLEVMSSNRRVHIQIKQL